MDSILNNSAALSELQALQKTQQSRATVQNPVSTGLVDADMNEASTRLQALQTQEQLGIQSLSVANQNAALILKLFGG